MGNSTAESDLIRRLDIAEARLAALEKKINDPVERIKRDLANRKVYSSSFVRVPGNYYDSPLSKRAGILKCTVPQLCKSIIFENTAWSDDGSIDRTNARFYLVVVQYQAKFDAELLRDLIHSLRPAASRLPRKRFHFQLADEEVSNKLSGFSHNAVSPFGMVSDIPIVICRRCTEVQPAYVFMGGGEVDLKLGISVSDFLRATNAIVGELSTPRALSADSVVDDD